MINLPGRLSWFMLLSVLLLAACGFQFRGNYSLPWQTIYLGLAENDSLYRELKSRIEAGGKTRVVKAAAEAEAVLEILRNDRHKSILSLSAAGKVREFELTRSFSYRLRDGKGNQLLPVDSIVLQREMTFDDDYIYAKASEEELIWNEMNSDLTLQLLRRLAQAQPAAASASK